MVQRANNPNMRHRAKFRADRSNCCRDIAIFRFFKMAAVRHIQLVVSILKQSTKSTWIISITVQNLVEIDAVVSTMWTFYHFACLA